MEKELKAGGVYYVDDVLGTYCEECLSNLTQIPGIIILYDYISEDGVECCECGVELENDYTIG